MRNKASSLLAALTFSLPLALTGCLGEESAEEFDGSFEFEVYDEKEDRLWQMDLRWVIDTEIVASESQHIRERLTSEVNYSDDEKHPNRVYVHGRLVNIGTIDDFVEASVTDDGGPLLRRGMRMLLLFRDPARGNFSRIEMQHLGTRRVGEFRAIRIDPEAGTFQVKTEHDEWFEPRRLTDPNQEYGLFAVPMGLYLRSSDGHSFDSIIDVKRRSEAFEDEKDEGGEDPDWL